MTVQRADRINVLSDVSVNRDGVTGLAMLAATSLAERGQDVTYLAGDRGENSQLTDAGVRIWGAGGKQINSEPRTRALVNGLYNKAALDRLARWIDENDSPGSVYYVNGWSKVFSPGIFRVLRPVMRRVVVHAHDFFLACPNGAFWDYRKNETCTRVPLSGSCLVTHCNQRSYIEKTWRVARTAILRNFFQTGAAAPEILLIHPAMRDDFLRSGFSDERLTVLRNPVVPFRAEPYDPRQKNMAAFVGRLEPEKGALSLARACEQAGVPLMVIGEGSQEAQIAQTGARMHGWCDRVQIAEALDDARFLVMPSHYPEPFGLVAAEALSSGLPVIVSDQALLAQEITEAGAGSAVDPENEDETATCLRAMCDNGAAIADFSKQALKLSHEIGLSPDRWINGLEAAFARALSSETRDIAIRPADRRLPIAGSARKDRKG